MFYSRTFWVNSALFCVRFTLFLLVFFFLGSLRNFTNATQTMLIFFVRFFSLIAFVSTLMVFFQLALNRNSKNRRYNVFFRLRMIIMLFFSLFSFFLIDFISTFLQSVVGGF
jgi:mannose/fructose/N-acetylgalactosamine-specific phosphotransferase system component IIC